MQKSQDNLRVALVHDFLIQYGGAERVLEAMSEMFPEAPVYTLLYDKEKMRGKFADRNIRTSFLQKFPKFLQKRYKYLLPLMPVAPETFDLRDFDLVISSSGAWSKGIVTRLNTIHVGYIHSPMRFIWDANEEYLREQKRGRILNFFSRLFSSYLRVWDYEAAQRPDYLIANSRYTQTRISKYYQRESAVIYPPIESNQRPSSAEDGPRPDKKGYFLIVSRLSPYKKINVAVEAFNKLGLPLVVIGEGPQEKYLHKIAADNVRILGWQSDEKVREYFAGARAFIFPAVDDFGIAPVESMSFGVPVVAIRKGGALETVEEGRSGEFFDAATPEVIADGVRRMIENEKNYDRRDIINRARKFSKERFLREFREFINKINN